VGAFRAARDVRSTRIGVPCCCRLGATAAAVAPSRSPSLRRPDSPWLRSLLVVAKSLHGAISCMIHAKCYEFVIDVL
jgi:hypothetical protein